MRLCVFIETNDLRRNSQKIVIPLPDFLRIVFWRAISSLCDKFGMKLRTSYEDTHPIRVKVYERFLVAALSSRNLLYQPNFRIPDPPTVESTQINLDTKTQGEPQ